MTRNVFARNKHPGKSPKWFFEFFLLTVDCQLGLLVDLVQPDGLWKLSLRADGAWIPFLVNPFDGERMDSREATNLTHLTHHGFISDARINVGDKHLPEMKKKNNSLYIFRCSGQYFKHQNWQFWPLASMKSLREKIQSRTRNYVHLNEPGKSGGNCQDSWRVVDF